MDHQSSSRQTCHVSHGPTTTSSSPSLTRPPYSFFKPGQKTTFFSLPLELRQEIYSLILGSNQWLEIPWRSMRNLHPPPEHWSRRPKSALLCTCKRICSEASDIIYKNVHLTLELSSDPNKLRSMSLENRQRIRKLELIIYWGSATRNCTLLDPKLWKPLLENLKMLEIIAEGPSDIKENSKLVESWRRWVGPIFEYINEELAPEVGVRIDDDGRHVTKALVEKYIKGHKVWRVKTFKGDIFFMRGQ